MLSDLPAAHAQLLAVQNALEKLDELRNTALPCARLREEMLGPARSLLKERIAELTAAAPRQEARRRFNFNDHVFVKLTAAAKASIEADRRATGLPEKYVAVAEVGGVSRWALWELMHACGDMLCPGRDVPFEMTAEMETAPCA